MAQRYALRADHDRHEYQVYDVGTGLTVKTFEYLKGSELSCGLANGRANLHRRKLNDEERKER